jgi:hypothetical protein
MAVRRIKQASTKYELGAVRLYQEDLRTIAAAIRELGEIRIICNGIYEASEPDDFGSQLPDEIEEVTIASVESNESASVAATFGPSASEVTMVNPDTHAAGVVSLIQSVCGAQRRRWWSLRRTSGPVLGWSAFAAFAILVPVVGDASGSSIWNSDFASNVLPLILLGLIPVGLGLRFLGNRRMAVIINAPRATRPSYLDRTRDAWIIGLITAIAGAVLGFALGKFT